MVQDMQARVATAPINALVLDDDDFDRRRICRMGAQSGLDMHVVSVPTIRAMETHLNDRVFDLILLDYRLANETGLDALQRIQAHEANAQAAKVMLTGHLKLDVAVAAFKSGCHDYVSKDDLNPGLLRQTVETVLEKSRRNRATTDVSEAMLDRAVYDLALNKLPDLLAQVLANPAIKDVVQPLMQDAVELGLEKTLSRYDLPVSVLADPQIQGLVAALGDDHQIRWND